MFDNLPTITLIGAGNVATHLALALKEAGYSVRCVFSRTMQAAEILAERVGAKPVCSLKDLLPADVCIYSVRDDVLPQVAGAVCALQPEALHVHTSGSMPLQVFPSEVRKPAVLYPLQTFSKSVVVDFSKVPCYVEGNTPEVEAEVTQLALKLSPCVRTLGSAGRRRLHLSAVFACNFVNRCYALAETVAAEAGVPFEELLPLIDETAAKVHRIPPHEAQTGPAVRGDRRVIGAHLSLLEDNEQWRTVYEVLSRNIMAAYHECGEQSSPLLSNMQQPLEDT